MNSDVVWYAIVLLVGCGIVWVTSQLVKMLFVLAIMSSGRNGVQKAKRRAITIPLALIASGTIVAALAGLNPLISAALLGGPLVLTVLTLMSLRAYNKKKQKAANGSTGGTSSDPNS